MRLQGTILDIYDDPKGEVLVRSLNGAELPAKLASAELLEPTDLAAIPDRLFALVARHGDSTIRKYAMHDSAHLATSLIYFLAQHEALPEDAQKLAAHNLLVGCSWYDVAPPDRLEKIAFLGAAMNVANGVMGAADVAGAAKSGLQKHRAAMAAIPKLAMDDRSFPQLSAESRLRPEEERVAGFDHPAHIDPDSRGRQTAQLSAADEKSAQGGGAVGPVERIMKSLGIKTADLNGTSEMPMSTLSAPTDKGPNRLRLATKTASIDLTTAFPTASAQAPTAEHYAMPDRSQYAIDTPEQLKMAERYFNEHVQAFQPHERRQFAQAVWDRGEDLGVKVAGAALTYAGSEYGPHIDAQLFLRERAYEGTGNEHGYTALRDKLASIPPMVMAQLLEEADLATGAWRSYGRFEMLDPYASVYGGAKTAADKKEIADVEYSWKDGTDYISGLQLKAMASRGAGQFGELFGAGFGLDFVKDPVGVFKSMPDPQKQMIVRIAKSQIQGSGTP